MKKLRLLLMTLCVTVLMGSMAVTAYAGGGEEWDGLDPVEPLPTETVDPGEGFTEDGNLVTRDLLYDKATNKQFITVQTSGGNTFYIVIDYDKPTDEDGEQYQTYFLNMVDEADLLAAIQAAGGELPECSCSDKCAVGAINTDCTVCAVNMSECQGKAPEPAPVVEPEPDPEPEQPKATGNGGMLLLALPVALGCSGSGSDSGSTTGAGSEAFPWHSPMFTAQTVQSGLIAPTAHLSAQEHSGSSPPAACIAASRSASSTIFKK